MNRSIKPVLTCFLWYTCCSLSIGQGYDEFIRIIKLYQEGRYDIISSKLKNQGYELDKYTPDYELDGVKYRGDFSFTLKENIYYNNSPSYGSPIELVNGWEFKTEEKPSSLEYEIRFKFRSEMAPVLFNSLRHTWIEEIGQPDSTYFCKYHAKYNSGKAVGDCAFFVDKREIAGKNIEEPNSLITLVPRKLFEISWSEFFSATKVIEGILHYRLVKFPIDQRPKDYFQNQSQGIKLQSLPLKKRGNLYTLELRIGDRNFDYIVDSGASDLNISETTEKYLKELGVIQPGDYLKPQIYTLADGSQREYRRILIPKIQLAGIVVENVSASISSDDSQPLLLGKSFLDKFTYWKIDNSASLVEFRLK